MRIFSYWLKTFRQSINGYDYYTDFQTVYKNAEKLKIEIFMLNSLVGSRDIENDFEELIAKYPECLKAIPILLAVRSNEIYCQDDTYGAIIYRFDELTQTPDQYKYFMRKTGLFEMLEEHIIDNLYDYVMGVEVGLGSNGRKNRGGHQMEDLVESYLKAAGVIYFKEMYLADVEAKTGIDLSAISGGTTTKRWDFVVLTNNCVYGIETNFYTGGGSKLNETARSYELIARESKDIEGFKFMWITDGIGWVSARGNLEKTFNVLENLYNINDLENGIFEEIFNNENE